MSRPAPQRAAILLHGGSPHRRAAVAAELQAALQAALQAGWGTEARIHRSSRAAEAAKWLADTGVVGVVLLDAPPDAEAVRLTAARSADRWVIATESSWTPAVIVDAVVAARRRAVSDPL